MSVLLIVLESWVPYNFKNKSMKHRSLNIINTDTIAIIASKFENVQDDLMNLYSEV